MIPKLRYSVIRFLPASIDHCSILLMPGTYASAGNLLTHNITVIKTSFLSVRSFTRAWFTSCRVLGGHCYTVCIKNRHVDTIHPFNMAMDWYIVRCNHCTGDFNHVIGSSALQLLLLWLLVGGTNIYEIGMLCTRVSRSSFLVLEKKSEHLRTLGH